jgi:hypothetical protein
MKRWGLAAAAAGFMAVCIAVPVQAAEWCLHDPAVNIHTSDGESFTVYVTEGVLGTQHQPALASAKITYITRTAGGDSVFVVVYDKIPTDSYGTFATEMVVSSEPYADGVIYGSSYGISGTVMSVPFWINSEKPKK